MVAASYLGNHSSHLWRGTELNPAVYGPGATTGNTNARRVLELANPDQGKFYGTIGQLDDTGRANYNALFLQAQRRLKNNLSVLANWTLSKCMSDPATTELTGPTIVDPNNPNADYCVLRVGPAPRREPVDRVAVAGVLERRASASLLSDWQFSPLVRWQSGDRSTVTTGIDNALTGDGRPAGGADSARPVRRRRGDELPEPLGVRVAGDRHLQLAGAVHDRQPVEPAERLRADADLPGRRGRARCSSGGRCSTCSTT